MKKIIYIISVAATLLGCRSVAPRNAMLSGAQAVEIAKIVAIENEVNLDFFKLKRISFQEKIGKWHVSYANKNYHPLRSPGEFDKPGAWAGPSISYYSFTVVIEDKTRTAKFYAQVFK
jgi:hypothetical protein